MVKKALILLSVFLVLISCFPTKNEFKKPRFTTIGLSPYKEKYILEDSLEIFNGFYKIEKAKGLGKIHESSEVRQNYLVFYSNGKIGRYLDFEESFDFNPKKAEMGFYGKKKGKSHMKYKYKFQGAYNLSEYEIIFLNKDSLITYSVPSANGGGFFSKYVKVHPKTSINKMNPDW
jgi:hypothetical protein